MLKELKEAFIKKGEFCLEDQVIEADVLKLVTISRYLPLVDNFNEKLLEQKPRRANAYVLGEAETRASAYVLDETTGITEGIGSKIEYLPVLYLKIKNE